MKPSLSSFRRIFFLFLVACLPLLDATAAPTGEMRAALDQLASQHLDQNWPATLRNARNDGLNNVRKGSIAEIDANAALSPTQRARAKATIDEMMPQLAAQVDAMFNRLDAHAVMLDMVETVYPKYFSAAEIQDLGAFYGSTAFQKTASIGQMVSEESERTGADPALLWERYSTRMTDQERKFVIQFRNSPLGKKQAELRPRISQEGTEYLNGRVSKTFDAAVTLFQFQFLKKLSDERKKQSSQK